jgi:hypothetical protein
VRMTWTLAALAGLLASCGALGGTSSNAVIAAAAGMEGALWPQFYQRAGELFQQGTRDEAVTLFYIGQLRARVRIQCQSGPPDREPALFASLGETIGRTINEYAGGSPSGWAAAIDQALAWDDAHPDPNAAGEACGVERGRQRQGLTELRHHIVDSADHIRSQRTAAGLPNR